MYPTIIITLVALNKSHFHRTSLAHGTVRPVAQARLLRRLFARGHPCLAGGPFAYPGQCFSLADLGVVDGLEYGERGSVGRELAVNPEYREPTVHLLPPKVAQKRVGCDGMLDVSDLPSLRHSSSDMPTPSFAVVPDVTGHGTPYTHRKSVLPQCGVGLCV